MLAEDVEVVPVVSVPVIQEGALAEIPEVELDYLVVAVEVDVGPDQPGDNADDQREGIFLYEGDVPAYLVHRFSSNRSLVVWGRFPAARKPRRLYHRIRGGPNTERAVRRSYSSEGVNLSSDPVCESSQCCMTA